MKKPKAQKQPPIVTTEEFRAVVDTIATKILQRDIVALQMEEELAAVRSRYETDLTPLDELIGVQFKRASKFAVLKRADLFAKGKKSSVTALAEFGFRDASKPTLTLREGFDWDDVTAAIRVRIDELKNDQAHLASWENLKHQALTVEIQRWEQLLVIKTEPVKDQIKACLTDEERGQIGAELTQKESFWIEPKREKEAKIIEEAA